MNIQSYLAQIADAMPRMMPEREQIVADVRAHIEEAVQHGEALDSVLTRLGDPTKLATSYLSEVPLVSASSWRRACAMAIDLAILVVIVGPVAFLVVKMDQERQVAFCLAVFAGYIAYFVVGESRYGQTPGKYVLNLLVVRESGARISAGQAFVRLLPIALHVWWIDAFFALFTEKRQRAFELLSKTRVITIEPATNMNFRLRPSGSIS